MRKSRTNLGNSSRKDEFLMALKQKYSLKPNIENSPHRAQRNLQRIPDSPSFGYSTIPRSAGVSPLAQRYPFLHLGISIASHPSIPHSRGNF